MKILVIQETDWIKRGPHQSHHLFERIVRLGHQVRVIDFDFDWDKKSNEGKILSRKKIIIAAPKVIDGVVIPVIRPGFIRVKGIDLISIGLTQFLQIIKQIKSFKPDLITSFGIVSGFSSLILSKLYKIPFCEYWIDVLPELIPLSVFQPLGVAISKITIKKCDLFLAINQRLLDHGIRFGSKNYRLIRAGVDSQVFSLKSQERKKIRQKFNIQDEEILLFFMGYLYNFSGLLEVIKSLSENEMKSTNLKLLIVGDGEQKKTLINIIKANSLDQRILLLPWQSYEKIPDLISAADICLLPSHDNKIMRDIIPIKLYEYLAMRKPVVSTALPGIIKEFGINSGVIYAQSSEDVIKICLKILDNDSLEDIGKKGREFVVTNCDWHEL
ncbi:MAG: glycosyltransferase, partial [Candidatus Hodarchaeota archaeon]